MKGKNDDVVLHLEIPWSVRNWEINWNTGKAKECRMV